ncbi:hypothetical protein CK203_007309 [Vitis vinifera]|uniref:Uncharacterized protein n=1 Tax=Vitis vinifera TaxID=29760 RepID=A0A438G1T8_VITVI|nr:hypothetical protein CK203_070464 [Vitis vinifera]RVW66173.1 hypothetical protein CK203_007309 [Vitis vinifera]
MARHKRSGGRKKCRLPRTPLPLKILRPEEEDDPQPQSRNKMAMQIESSTFKLPRDWVVRKVRRASGKSCGLIDKERKGHWLFSEASNEDGELSRALYRDEGTIQLVSVDAQPMGDPGGENGFNMYPVFLFWQAYKARSLCIKLRL